MLSAETADLAPPARGAATTLRATGALQAAPSTTGGGRRKRRRRAGAATPVDDEGPGSGSNPPRHAQRTASIWTHAGSSVAAPPARRAGWRPTPRPTRSQAPWVECRALPPARKTRFGRRLKPFLLPALVLAAAAGRAFGGARQLPHPEIRWVPERQPDRLALPDHPVPGGSGLRRSSRAPSSTRSSASGPSSSPVAAQIHGNTPLEIGWTVGGGADPGRDHRGHVRQAPVDHQPAQLQLHRLLPVRLGHRADAAERQEARPICVQGRQFIWRYVYGNGCLNNAFAAKLPYSYTEMYVPAGRRR